MAEDFDRGEWLQHTSRLLKVAMVAYWKARVAANPKLDVLDAAMLVQLQVELPTILVESFLCEVLSPAHASQRDGSGAVVLETVSSTLAEVSRRISQRLTRMAPAADEQEMSRVRV